MWGYCVAESHAGEEGMFCHGNRGLSAGRLGVKWWWVGEGILSTSLKAKASQRKSLIHLF